MHRGDLVRGIFEAGLRAGRRCRIERAADTPALWPRARCSEASMLITTVPRARRGRAAERTKGFNATGAGTRSWRTSPIRDAGRTRRRSPSARNAAASWVSTARPRDRRPDAGPASRRCGARGWPARLWRRSRSARRVKPGADQRPRSVTVTPGLWPPPAAGLHADASSSDGLSCAMPPSCASRCLPVAECVAPNPCSNRGHVRQALRRVPALGDPSPITPPGAR